MRTDKNSSDKVEFVVGSEKSLKEVIAEAEVMPLLKGAVRSGATGARVTDPEGNVIWMVGEPVQSGDHTETRLLHLEGEIVANIVMSGQSQKESFLKGISELLFDTVNIIMNNNLKRMLTTEIHTTVVNQSYEELLETNRRLSISEGKYRELAEDLEKKVQERTKELERAHARLLQQEKIAAVGQLAAGVAHEINNPLGFIASNLNTLESYTTKFKAMLDLYRELFEKSDITHAFQQTSRQRWKDLKLDYIYSDVEELIQQSLEGAERVKNIVSDLKGFSHIDDSNEAVIDINEELDRTLNVLSYEIPEGTELIKEYHPLPGFTCNPALLCQVFLNIILNSLQARREDLELVIRTECENNQITISFSDNGPGIPEEIRNRIFEPFYSTKDVGQGKGMGLTAAYEVITSYGGTIEVESQPGKNTTVIIMLPLKQYSGG